jgi:hypothetical protein
MKTHISASIIADSVAPDDTRLTSFILKFPRIVLAEFNTHRVLSRNSASSRAIPFKTMMNMVIHDPFIPLEFQVDHKGMQGTKNLKGELLEQAIYFWLEARDSAVQSALDLHTLDEQESFLFLDLDKLLEDSPVKVTKQLCNRLLEPFLWHTVIATGTDWENFFALRYHDAAEIHIGKLAEEMLTAYNLSIPIKKTVGEWHIPFGDKIQESRLTDQLSYDRISDPVLVQKFLQDKKLKIATARCARVSYLNYEGKDDYDADEKLYDNLLNMGHMSPFEHCARVDESAALNGNFRGQWTQLRKLFTQENKKDNRIKSWKK